MSANCLGPKTRSSTRAMRRYSGRAVKPELRCSWPLKTSISDSLQTEISGLRSKIRNSSKSGTHGPRASHPTAPIRPDPKARPFPSPITRYRISPEPMSVDCVRPGDGRIADIRLVGQAKRPDLLTRHAEKTPATEFPILYVQQSGN